MVRDLDEDSVAVFDISGSYESQNFRRVFAIVADGMGGASKGEVASYLAVKAVSDSVLPMLSGKGVETEEYMKILKDSFLRANETVVERALSGPEYRGMGTTASAAIIDLGQLFVAHVGDTRVYVIKKDDIRQVTRDHSYVQMLVDSGEITAEQARNHPRKNEITRAIGVGSRLETDFYSRVLEDGAYVLICCDGLVNELTDEEIMREVLGSGKLQDTCDRLVKLANERGGRDNISVILVGPVEASESEERNGQELLGQLGREIAEGGELVPSGSGLWCTKCGEPVDPLTKKCRVCGTELEEAKTPEKLDETPRNEEAS
jgi:serine/threonine protein phosphatase PrpC